MPTTTRSRTQKSRTTTELERARELEALDAGIAPGLPGDDPGEFVERAGIGAGQPRRGALAGTLRRSRQGCLMRLLTEPLAAAGSVNLWGCRLSGGSATR